MTILCRIRNLYRFRIPIKCLHDSKLFYKWIIKKKHNCTSIICCRFALKNGQATYQCRFLKTDTLKRNNKAQRIVVSEFATRSVPDPCHTIFDRYIIILKWHRYLISTHVTSNFTSSSTTKMKKSISVYFIYRGC